MRPIRSFSKLLVVFTLGLPSAPALAAVAERLAVQRLVTAEDPAPIVTTDPVTDAIVVLRAMAVPLVDGREHPAAAACNWMTAHAEAFGLRAGVDRVRVERFERLADGSGRVLLRQYWNEIPVEGGEARCVVAESGSLRFVASGFLSALAAPRAPGVSRATAVAIAATALGTTLAHNVAACELWVRRRGMSDRLAWAVRFPLANGLEPRVWVDGVSGEVLETEGGWANAVGLVYRTDPRGPVEEVPLARLEPGVGLVSHLFAIEDQLFPAVTPRGPNGDYRYPPEDSLFDQVNVYWHADRFLHDFLGGLGYAGPPESLIVRANVATEPFVASTNGRYVSLGRAIPGFVRDVSRAADIIYHELTHAVIYGYGIVPTGPNRESGAFHEGLADYFACALIGDPVIGQWLYLTFPNGVTRVDQPLPKWTYCNYDHVAFGGGDFGSPWGNGMILSSAMWDLRRAIGSSADSLVLESFAYLPSSPIWAQFANALLQADQDHHGGRFESSIVHALLPRCIRGVAVASIQGPTTLKPGVEGTFEASPCCGGRLGRDHWRVRGWCRGAPCGEWRDAGDETTLRVTFDEDSELQLTVQTPWGDTLHASQFVGVRPPELIVEGPHQVGQHAQATWGARINAMGPAHVSWMRQWRRPGAQPEQLGEALERSFAADTSLDLTATLVDGLNRVVQQRVVVETFVDHPPPLGSGVLHMTQSLDAGARQAETTIELTRATPLRLSVFDVRGRIRATLWNGPAGRGAHVIRWDASGLEPGVYFLRLLAEPTGLLQRFVVLR